MPEEAISLPPATLDKLARLANLLSQASQVARELSQTHPNLHFNIPVLHTPTGVPQDQAWFWTPEWQAEERAVDEELAQGEYDEFENVEDLIADLHKAV